MKFVLQLPTSELMRTNGTLRRKAAIANIARFPPSVQFVDITNRLCECRLGVGFRISPRPEKCCLVCRIQQRYNAAKLTYGHRFR